MSHAPSLPLDRPRWLARDVVGDPVDAADFVDDPRRIADQELVGEGRSSAVMPSVEVTACKAQASS